MDIILTYGRTESIHKQVANQIKQRIIRGDYVPGDQLPTLQALSEKAQICNMTAIKSYKLLQQQGFVYSVPGRGYFVSENAGKIQPAQAELVDKLLLQAINAAQVAEMDKTYLIRHFAILVKSGSTQND